MILLRLAVIAIVLWFAFRLVRRFIRPTPKRDPDSTYAGKMVPCAICGVFLPESDAVRRDSGELVCPKHGP